MNIFIAAYKSKVITRSCKLSHKLRHPYDKIIIAWQKLNEFFEKLNIVSLKFDLKEETSLFTLTIEIFQPYEAQK